jgi:hypothetical protein
MRPFDSRSGALTLKAAFGAAVPFVLAFAACPDAVVAPKNAAPARMNAALYHFDRNINILP